MKKRVFKQTMAIMLALAMLCGMVPGMGIFVQKAYAESPAPLGSGTKADPYQIASASDLLWIAENNAAQSGFEGKYFKMTDDITFSDADFEENGAFYNDGVGWVPIGTLSNPFKGIFDGDGHSITGIFIDFHYNYTGLFAVVGTGAEIANLALEDVDISGTHYTGGLVGESSGTIRNCQVGGVVKGRDYTGGLAGRNTSVIDNSFSTGRVIAENSGSVWGFGGLVGENSASGSISHSYSVADVEGNSFGQSLGGLVGDNRGEIAKSYAAGAVSGVYHAGGLAGSSIGTIVDSFAYGPVICSYNAGGLVGSIWGGSVQSSYAAGTLTGEEGFLGGLTSENDGGTITDSYYDSDITGQSDSDKGEPKTTAAMKAKETFAGWDFENTWSIVDTADHCSYPYLKWMACDETDAPGYGLKEQGGGSGTADGADTDAAGNTYNYTVNGDGTATITGFTLAAGGSTDITIPAALDGLTVTKIGEGAFYEIELTGAALPGTITDIGDSAFANNSLTELTIPENPTSGAIVIGENAFSGNKISKLIFPENTSVTIGKEAFSYNRLMSIIIPENVTAIGESGFSNNSIYYALIFNNDLSIGNNAFGNQYDYFNERPVSQVVFFANSGSATENYVNSTYYEIVYLNPADGGYVEDNGNIYVYTQNAYGQTATITGFFRGDSADIVIPGTVNGLTVTRIGERTFAAKALESVVIPEGVVEIGNEAFVGYDENGGYEDQLSNRLSNITIPASVTSIGDYAFSKQGYMDEDYYWYNTLTEVAFAGGADSRLESIGEDAFAFNALTSVEIPQNVKTIGSSAFRYQYDNEYDENNTLTTVTFAGEEDSKLESIGDNAFRNNSITEITIPGGVQSIGSSAFSRNSLSTLDIPVNVQSIGAEAFYSNQLNEVTIRNSNATIGDYAFNGNKGNPQDLTIKGYAGSTAQAYATANGHTFIELSASNQITDNGNTYTYTVADGKVTITAFTSGGSADITIPSIIHDYPVTGIGTEAFKNKGLTSVTIPSSVTSIGDGAFSENQLTNVIIPDGVTRIGDNVFANNNIASITIPNGVTSIGEGAFVYNELTSVVIPHSVTSIGPNAFSCNQLTSITIPNSVTSIGEGAFFNNQLTSATIPDSITSIEKQVFCRNQLTSIIIPNSVTSIGEGAFAYNQLTSVTIPNSATSIGDGAFFNNQLTNITIPGSITSIGEQTFCRNRLTSVTIPNSVTSIGEGAFAYNQLTDATIENSTAIIGNNAFSANQSTASNLKIHGHAGSTAEAYATANGHTFTELICRYTVTYNGNGSTSGTVPTDSNNYAQGATVTVLGNTGSLVKTGYTFAGWNTKADGTGTDYTAGATFTMGTTNVTLYAKWTTTGGSGNNSDNNGGSSGNSSTPAPANNSSDILVNGQAQGNAAIIKTEEGTNGRTTTTVILDEKKVEEILSKLPDADKSTGTVQNPPVITIPVVGKTDTAVGELNGQIVKDMENKGVILEVKTETATYTLPAQQIDISAVSQSVGQDVKLSDIKVQIEIAKPDNATVKVVEDSANKGSFTLVVPPVEFKISCTYGNKTVEVSQFNSYVERTVAIPEGVEPSKITTGIVVEPDGTVRHVPTKVIVIDGKYYAQINSLTNSTYSVIWHPVEFKDVTKHWAKDAINDMGSRMVISGVGSDMFDPDRNITRAEFVAIVVRALGLKPGSGNIPFTDVKSTDWFSGYVITAAEHKFISGYGNGKFGPNDKITREQAMTMVTRAMKITGLKVEFASGELEKLLVGFGDADKAAVYAKDSIAACIKTGIISGRGSSFIAPKENITRAEVAVIVRRLLQNSGLI